MKNYVYVLFSLKDRLLYIGSTQNLIRRIRRHQAGKVKATKLRKPFKLIHYEYFIDKTEALTREEFLKSGYGRKQLKEFLKNTIETLSL